MPAKAGIQARAHKIRKFAWIPACAGMTNVGHPLHLVFQQPGGTFRRLHTDYSVPVPPLREALETLWPSGLS
ncbi:MAG TPA: hypothetical protein VIZ17_07900, partial [Acetobacteraceae bacterium]